MRERMHVRTSARVSESEPDGDVFSLKGAFSPTWKETPSQEPIDQGCWKDLQL